MLRAVGPARAAGAIAAARPAAAGSLLTTLGAPDAGPVVEAMAADDAVAALREVPPDDRLNEAADAATALAPLAGGLAATLFAGGLLGAALLAASILPLSTAYSVSEALGVEGRLDDPWREARVFHVTYVLVVLVAVAVVLVPGAPLVPILVITQALNAVLLLPLLVFIRGLSCDRALMGPHVLGRVGRVATAVAIAGLAACVGALAVLAAGA